MTKKMKAKYKLAQEQIISDRKEVEQIEETLRTLHLRYDPLVKAYEKRKAQVELIKAEFLKAKQTMSSMMSEQKDVMRTIKTKNTILEKEDARQVRSDEGKQRCCTARACKNSLTDVFRLSLFRLAPPPRPRLQHGSGLDVHQRHDGGGHVEEVRVEEAAGSECPSWAEGGAEGGSREGRSSEFTHSRGGGW